MRDILTILAGLVILVLAAALAVPPLVDWSAQRGLIESGLARAFGQEVRTDGPISLRILPTPRLRIRRLRIGPPGAETASLDAMYVRAEIALTPLLSGEIRVLDTRIGRAEIKLPVGANGDWRVPARPFGDVGRHRDWIFDDLRIEQFLLTTIDPGTGRTDQYDAELVRIQAASLSGPWRFECRQRGVPIEIALGEIADHKAPLRLGFGESGAARLDLDGQLTLFPVPGNRLQPRVTGTAKLKAILGDLPLQAQANVAAREGAAELADLVVEAGEGAATLRLTGEGRFLLRDPALSLKLAARRLDPALPGRIAGAFGGGRALPVPVDLSLTAESLPIGGDEDLTGLSLSLQAQGRTAEVSSFEASGPGRSKIRSNGSLWFGAAPGALGQVKVEAQDGQRLALALEAQGLQGIAGFITPTPLEASAEVAVFSPVVSLRDLRLAQGDLRLSGLIRHDAADGGARPRLDAQLAIQGLDISALGESSRIFSLARDHDLGLSIDARNVAHGGRKGGRISGRIVTEGPAIVVDGLEVRDLAGAEANLSGRIAPDGTGRIEGWLKAPRAAPLLDLFGEAWIGRFARLVPAAMRDDPMDMRVELEQSRNEKTAAPAIRTRLEGRFGGAPFEAETRKAGGLLSAFTLRTDLAAALGLSTGAATSPGFMLAGKHSPEGRLAATASGEIGGLSIRTVAPFVFGDADALPTGGGITLDGTDAGPLLARLGIKAPGPVPVALRLGLTGQARGEIDIAGEVSGTRISAQLSESGPRDIAGRIALDRLSLPWLAGLLALGPAPAGDTGFWPTGRFAPAPALPFDGSVTVKAARLDLGLGLAATDAAFTLAAREGGMRLSGVDARLGEARLRGNLGLDRQGGLAAARIDAIIEGLPISALLGPPFSAGRITAKLQLGASGESVAAIMANLGGAGDVSLTDLSIADADPAAPARLASRALATDEPLAGRNFEPLLGEELGRAPLAAAGPISAPGALVGGALRLSPLRIEASGGTWQGTATLDLRSFSLDARGTLQATSPPPGWSGAPPTLGLGWAGPFRGINRTIDQAPLVNGLATNVLSRELERIDRFDREDTERRRRGGDTLPAAPREARPPSSGG